MNDQTITSNAGTAGASSSQTSIMHSERVRGALTMVLVILAVFLFAETIKSLKEYRYVGGAVAPSNVVTVSGEGEVFSVPDTAEFTFSVMEEAATVAEVTKKASERSDAAINALKEKGVEEKDIKTVSYELHPKYEWQPLYCTGYCERKQVQKGFELNQSVRVKVRDLAKAGEMLETATGAGVQSVSGLSFTIADEDGLQADARKQAIDDARTKAERLAADLGVALVRIVGFSENEGYVPMPMYARMEMDMAAPAAKDEEATISVPAGENRIVSNVQITYEIR